jgi:hypothetical protein
VRRLGRDAEVVTNHLERGARLAQLYADSPADAAVQRERSYDTTAIDLKFTSFFVHAGQLTNLRACGGGRVLAVCFGFLGSLPGASI